MESVEKKLKGTVKWWSSKRGYGFITGNDGQDYFAHYKQIRGEGHRDLEEGGKVEFEPRPTEKGPSAVQIVTL